MVSPIVLAWIIQWRHTDYDLRDSFRVLTIWNVALAVSVAVLYCGILFLKVLGINLAV